MSRTKFRMLVKVFIFLFIFLFIISSTPLNTISQNCFGIGSTKSIVLQIMGKPTNIYSFSYLNEETWYYGLSSITFKNGKVYEYNNLSKNLKVWLGSVKKDAPSIKIGSTKQNVLNAMGTPTAVMVFEYLNEETWYYGLSSITFKNGKVYEYNNLSKNLKVYVGSSTKNYAPITKGSSKSNVINSLGTPTAVMVFEYLNEETWYYGLSSINFRKNLVYSWYDFGELKGHVSTINYYKGNEENINYSEVSPYSIIITNSNKKIVPFIAENGSYYGQISKITGRPKTVYVKGYYRKDGTYVRSHYRSKPIKP